jgi:hypothetical protein
MGNRLLAWAGNGLGRLDEALARWGERDLARILGDYEDPRSQAGDSGGVEILFHTYWGLLAHIVQHEHRYRLQPPQAKRLLRRLHYYNLRHGFLTWYAPVLALNSRLQYLRQLRRIRQQMRKGR